MYQILTKMKNMKKKSNLIKCLLPICSFVIIALISSCKREEVKPADMTLPKDVKIQVLKVYLSDLTRVDTGKIYYNAIEEVFLIDGVRQISREDLDSLYTNSPIIHYKNGIAVPNN